MHYSTVDTSDNVTPLSSGPEFKDEIKDVVFDAINAFFLNNTHLVISNINAPAAPQTAPQTPGYGWYNTGGYIMFEVSEKSNTNIDAYAEKIFKVK